MTSYAGGLPPSTDEMIRNAYAGIGREGIGSGVQNIDQAGFDYWKGQIESGALGSDPMLPNSFQNAFSGAVRGALQDPNLANTAQYQYINNYLNAPKGALAGVTSTGPGDIGTPIDTYMPPTKPFPGIDVNRGDKLYEPPGYATTPGFSGSIYDLMGGDNINRPIGPVTLPTVDSGRGDYFQPQTYAAAERIRDDINQMYRDVLGREADTEGLNYWTQQFGGHGQLTPEDRATWMSIAKPGATYNPNQITALGDSTTWGYNMGNRVDRNMTDVAQGILQQDLGRDIQINNMGVNGSSLGDAISRGDIDKAAQDGSATVLLNYGMNEAYRQQDPQEFANNLLTAINQLKQAGKDVVLQTPNYTEGIPGVNTYADVIRRVAAKTGATLDDKWDATSSLYGQYDKNDPVHPTQQIYTLLGNNLANLLKRKYRA